MLRREAKEPLFVESSNSKQSRSRLVTPSEHPQEKRFQLALLGAVRWMRKKVIAVATQLEAIAPSENQLRRELLHCSRLPGSTRIGLRRDER